MKKIWLFGSYNWQGNVKALFLYMDKFNKDTHELWWIADDEEGAAIVRNFGYKATVYNSVMAQELFQKANVYVTENVRVKYPVNLSGETIILNLWHGVGIKHVELGLGMGSKLTQNIIGKYVQHYQLLKNQMKFLVTSEMMEKHFKKEIPLDDSQIIKGSYPRNSVYQKYGIRSFDMREAYNVELADYQQVLLYAPTWRNVGNGLLRRLLPNLAKLNHVLHERNTLFILKMHPHDVQDPIYQEALNKKDSYPNILFWKDAFDIYEIFDQIDVGIVDYSSIFYDMLDAGVKKYIRYIPDHEQYLRESELIEDYYAFTLGEICHDFGELLRTLNMEIPDVDGTKLLAHFFEYNESSVEELIQYADSAITKKENFPELHTFDIFDTIIRRKGIEPESVFYLVQAELKKASSLNFPEYLVECYPTIRHDVEFDTRISYRKTTFERNSDTVEVTLDAILTRLQKNYGLSDEQKNFLFTTETALEIEVTEPRQKMIDEYFSLKRAGHEVFLISDMYLPEHVIRQMIIKVDPRFAEEKLFLSATLGYQKSLGTLYEYVFFNCDYHYRRWVHHGDNKRADGSVPRRYGIVTFNHDMDSYLPYEEELIERAPIAYRNDAFSIAKKMQQYRWRCINEAEMTFNGHMYYNYAYIGSAFVPYVYWSLTHAIKQGYDAVYFISRDGYFLKQIADVLIEKLNLNIKSKFIYASRKVWRVPSFINEIDPASFTPFGMFSNMSNFGEMVSASQLNEQELLEILPELENYRNEPTLKGDIAIEIRKIFEHSQAYKERLLKIAAERRPIVLDYIKQEIDFDEKFAFVEFWGRGYTQDTFTRLLHECFNGEFLNPFYYVRNFTDDIGASVRHRFTTLPYDFSYYEPIFAQTPYKSIAKYQREENGSISPVIIPQKNDFHEAISQGLEDFATDFSDLIKTAEKGFYRYLAEFAYTYQYQTPLDSVIVENLSEIKDNVGMYGEPVEFAPEFTEEVIKEVGIENLRSYTRSMGMSMARSSEEIREFINTKLKTDFEGKTLSFPSQNISNYVAIKQFPTTVIVKQNQEIYQNISWSKNSVRNRQLTKGDLITAIGYEWTANGTPRLVTSDGYISAHKDYVRAIQPGDVLYVCQEVPVYAGPDENEIKLTLEENAKLVVEDYVHSGTKEYVLINKGYLRIEGILFAAFPIADGEEHKISNGLVFMKTKAEKLSEKKLLLDGPITFYSEPSLKSKSTQVDTCKKKRFVKYLGEVETDSGLRFFKTERGYILALVGSIRVCRKDIEKFIVDPVSKVQLLRPIYLYTDTSFDSKTKTEKQFKKSDVVDVYGISWSGAGTPRLKVKGGFISANRKLVRSIESEDSFGAHLMQLIKRIISGR